MPSRFWSGWWWSAIRGALSGGEKGDDAALLSTSQLQYHRRYEGPMEQRIHEMVERVLGPNMAIVRVSVDMDFTRLEQVGAVEELSLYGELLGVPVEVARDYRDLADIVDRYGRASLICVDTLGRGPGDMHHIAHLRGSFRRIPSLEVHLVLSATTREQEMEAVAKGFYEVPFHRVLFTKVDEGVVLGQC